MPRRLKLIGQKFERLKVIRSAGVNSAGATKWDCICDCGKEVTVLGFNLKKGATKSCGCYRDENLGKQAVTHGEYGTPRNQMWKSASRRAKVKGIPFELKMADIPQIPDVCPILGIPLARGYGVGGFTFNSPTLDRIRPELGYVPCNVQIISQRANVIKNDATAEEIQKVADYMKGVKLCTKVTS